MVVKKYDRLIGKTRMWGNLRILRPLIGAKVKGKMAGGDKW